MVNSTNLILDHNEDIDDHSENMATEPKVALKVADGSKGKLAAIVPEPFETQEITFRNCNKYGFHVGKDRANGILLSRSAKQLTRVLLGRRAPLG